MKVNNLILLILFSGLTAHCGKSHKSSASPNPPAIPNDDSDDRPSGGPGGPVVNPGSDPGPQQPAFDPANGPLYEPFEIDLSSFHAASKISLGASFDMQAFALRSGLALSSKFHPTLTVDCDAKVTDRSSAFVLAPLKTLRLAALADVTGCAKATIYIPRNPVGYLFTPSASDFSWFVDVTSADGSILRYRDQTEKSSIIVKQGEAKADVSVSLKIADLLPSEGIDPKPRYQLVAFRQLTNYQTGSLQISSKFWPKLSLSCDGKVLDESIALSKSTLPLRLTVQADITECQDVKVGPDEGHADGTFADEQSFIVWSLVRLDG